MNDHMDTNDTQPQTIPAAPPTPTPSAPASAPAGGLVGVALRGELVAEVPAGKRSAVLQVTRNGGQRPTIALYGHRTSDRGVHFRHFSGAFDGKDLGKLIRVLTEELRGLHRIAQERRRARAATATGPDTNSPAVAEQPTAPLANAHSRPSRRRETGLEVRAPGQPPRSWSQTARSGS
jgi:hypothetical protein